MTHAARCGTTLLELTMTMSILAIIAGVTVMAVRRFDAPAPGDPHAIVADSLRASVATGSARGVRVMIRGSMAAAWIRPDGSVISDSAFELERFQGAPRRAR